MRKRACVTGLTGLSILMLVVGSGCRSSSQIGAIELWLPPGAVTAPDPVVGPLEPGVTFTVTSKPIVLSESVVAYYAARRVRVGEIHSWTPLPSSGILREPGVPNRPVLSWAGSWKDDDGNTLHYSLRTYA